MKTCLLDIRHTGEERHKNFVRECLDNPTRFEEPIKRMKLLTFKQDGISHRRSTNMIIAELKCSRDLMGRFLIFAPKRHFDLSHVFTFPLTPMPLSLCYCDGTMAKTEKTALFRHLESKVESSFPSSASVDACVVDGSFLVGVHFLRIYPQRTAGSPQQSSFKQQHCQQTCRHYLRHIRNAINQKDGKGTKRYVRSELQEHRTTTDTPCRFQRGTQITIIQNRVAYIPNE